MDCFSHDFEKKMLLDETFFLLFLIDPEKALLDLMKKETKKLTNIKQAMEKLAKKHRPFTWVGCEQIR